jgi:ATP:ADP antiporter, AAA family
MLLAGHVLRLGGATVALSIVPLVCACLTALLAAYASPASFVFAETLRKVVSYSFAKPARELLFTKVPDDAKYKAKLILDTVVQRLGDALGAAIFSMLGKLQSPDNLISALQNLANINQSCLYRLDQLVVKDCQP